MDNKSIAIFVNELLKISRNVQINKPKQKIDVWLSPDELSLFKKKYLGTLRYNTKIGKGIYIIEIKFSDVPKAGFLKRLRFLL